MAKVSKIERGQLLADVVQAWARDHDALDHPYVYGLTKALQENKNLAMWSTIDPIAMLPKPVNEKHSYLFNLYRRLNIVRNALVFAPVAVTWLAVGKATSAFQEFVEKNTLATVNFLEFWENGYGVLADEWRISVVATTDFIIVLIVIILTIISNFLGEIANKRENEHDEILNRERIELGLAIKDFLFTKQTISRLTLNQGVATAIENLVVATENLQKPKRRRTIKPK